MSQYHAIWDPNGDGSRIWSIQMIQEERCLAPDHVDGRADNWQIDATSGVIRSYGHESYLAVTCQYGG